MRISMKTRIRQFSAFVLCLAMLISLLAPVGKTVYADDIEPERVVTEVPEEEREEPVPTYVKDENLLDETTPDLIPAPEGEEELNAIDEKYEAAIVSEDSERRDLYSKDFLLEDMTRLLVLYPDAVHFRKDGLWTDIDNSLELTIDEKTGMNVYLNKANCVQIQLPEELNAENGPIVSFGEDSLEFTFLGVLEDEKEEIRPSMIEESEDYADTEEPAAGIVTEEPTSELDTIIETELGEADDITAEIAETMETEAAEETAEEADSEEIPESEPVYLREITEIAPSKAEIKNSALSEEELALLTERERRILPLKLFSEAAYRDVLTGTDVRYDLNSTALKESIVLNHAPETNTSYIFHLFSDSLELKLNENNTISAVNASGEEIFTIPAPFAYDTAEERSHDVQVTLENIESGYELTITPDYGWLTSSDRVYPVVIDPSVITTQIRENIKDMAVASNGGNNYNDDYLEAGYHSTRGKERIFIKFEALPKLSAADVIVDANLMLYRGINASANLQINAHKVEEAWESNTVTWANQPSYDSTITDYAKVSSYGWYQWSITEIARDWFLEDDVNTGLMLKAPNSTENAGSNNNRTFFSSDYASSVYRPVLTIAYINNSGCEGYWDYDSYDLGRAGTAFVSLFTGNMVLKRTDLAYAGNRMPVSIDFTYNVNDKRMRGSSGTQVTGGYFGLGNGWRTNYNQRVYLYVPSDGTSTGSLTYYIWEDEDGTRHYFKGESATGTFTDESGVEVNGDVKYEITDKNGGKSFFDTSGRLRKISNNQATKSSILVTYLTSGNTERISTVTDGAGRVYQFSYDSTTGYLTGIQYKGSGSAALSSVSYSINSNGNLKTVTYSDSTSIGYSYSKNAILSAAVTPPGSSARTIAQMAYTTLSNFLPNRLKTVRICDESDSSIYSTNSYTYGNGYTLAADMNGNVLEYQFNKYGNTVSMQDKQGRAFYAKYATDTDGSAKKNRLKHASKLQSTTNNVFKNPSFERNEFWYSAVSDTAAGTAGYTSEEHYLGEDCFKLTKTSSAGYSWVYAGASAGVSLKPNTTYTFSVYLKVEGVTSAQGVRVCGHVNGTGTYSYTGTTDGWQRIEVTVDTPSSVTTCNFYVSLDVPGTVYVDCMQLEENSLSSRFNLIENSDFTYYNGTTDVCYAWNEGSACVSTEKRVSISSGLIGAKNIDNNVYTMTGAITEHKRSYQDIPGSGSAGDTYSIGGWAKGNAAPAKSDSYSNGNLFAIVLRFYNTDNTTSEFRADFNPDLYESDTWQYACERVLAPKNYSAIRVLLVYEMNVNTVYFDAVQLYKDEFGSSYIYDENGNVTSVTDSRKQQNNYEYSSNNLTKATLHDGAVYNYTYDTYHNVTTATFATGTKGTFGYDTYGNNTRVTIVNPTNASDRVIQSTATYANDGNTLASVTDPLNKTTNYSYNNNTGILNSVTENSATTNYTYDNLYRLTGASRAYESGTAQVQYSYLNDHLTGITYGGTNSLSYALTYGTFGQLTKVTAGGTTLVTNSYTYNSSTNLYYDLSSVVYGNGARVDYTYDSLGNLKSKKYDSDSTKTVTYFYDNEGKPGKVCDDVQDLTHKYVYDISGRLVSDTESGWRSFTTTYGYDTNDNVSRVKDKISSVTYENNYSFDADNRPTTATSGSASTSITYDNYGRKNAETVKHGSTTVVTTSITYYDPSTTKTSLLPSTYNNALNGPDKNYTYTYDINGNIASITDGDGKHRSYKYDKLGQLVRENDEVSGNTWVFNYDTRGNITSKVRYAYTTASTLGTALETVPYTYQSSGWKDILTGVGSTTYTNDAIGNRLSDGTWTYTWQHGRELASMSKSGMSIAYGYDADGQRIYKNVTEGSTTTNINYYYRNGNLIDALWGSNRIHIFYDASGSPVSITYNGTQYYYVKNLQGDIVGLTNTSGTLVVEYEYDAWGKLLSTTGSAASTIGQANPLRFRGYVFDTETGLYYLGSRYYDPGVGRFVSADDVTYLGVNGTFTNYNLYTYCSNNPIGMTDAGGTFGISATLGIMLVGGAIGAVISAASSAVTQYICEGEVNLNSVGVSAASGFVSGFIAASPLGLIGQVAAGGIIGGASYVADCYVNKKDAKFGGLIISVGAGMLSGFIGGQGANKNNELSNTIKSGKKIINDLVRRSSNEVINKRIVQAQSYVYETIASAAWTSSIKFSFGVGLSNSLCGLYNKINRNRDITVFQFK